jgi:hypothetical protein
MRAARARSSPRAAARLLTTSAISPAILPAAAASMRAWRFVPSPEIRTATRAELMISTPRPAGGEWRLFRN